MNEQRMFELGFVRPQTQPRLFDIKHWSKNEIQNDYIYSLTEKVDNITLARGSYLHIAAKYAGSFILEEGATLEAPNLIKCNSILLKNGAKAWVPNLEKTEEGWFAGSDINRNGTVLVEQNSLIYAPKAKMKYRAGPGIFAN